MALETEIKLSLPANAARRVPAHRLLADKQADATETDQYLLRHA
jgi:hypothetical protein